ncbi:MAG: translation initiation factor eIF-2B subunit alpha [Vezdaea aestivalis]|nr:MAG: translation initiation factor eIF-2B subunit alpha [Vezdaea aestivalis]
MGPVTFTLEDEDFADFNIVQTYNRILASDQALTMPIAAIDSLVELLSVSTTSTISETLEVLQTATATLKYAIPNSISLSAGTDLFTRFLVATLQRPVSGAGAADFDTVREHLVRNGRLFVERAKAARGDVAMWGGGLVRDGQTVLTNGASRVVAALLKKVAMQRWDASRYQVIYVLADEGEEADRGQEHIRSIRAEGVPVAVVPEAAVAHVMSTVDIVLVGAEGVVENGGVVSRLGTYQMALVARALNKPVYVLAESHKFVRVFPLGQFDLPVEQHVLAYKADNEPELPKPKSTRDSQTIVATQRGARGQVDYTPPELIQGIVTESGIIMPSAVSEELMKIWL